MTTKTKPQVSKAQAEKVLNKVKAKYSILFGDGIQEPVLIKDWVSWSGGRPIPWVVMWEDGPYDWAVSGNWEFPVEGLFLEPYTGWILTINPDW